MAYLLWVLVVLLASGISGRDTGRALVVFPGPAKSHGVLGYSIVRTLLDAGYEVTYITPFPVKTKVPELTQIDISPVINDARNRELLKKASIGELPTQYITTFVGFYLTKMTLQHHEVRGLMMDISISFDVVLAQWLNTGLLAPLADVFDCPLIWYTSSIVSWQVLDLIHEASSPTYSYDVTLAEAPTLPMALAERTHQMWLQLYRSLSNKYHISSIEVAAYKEIYLKPLERKEKVLSNYENAVYNGSLLLLDSHPLFSENVAIPKNMKFIGGHHISTNISIAKNLKIILDQSVQGIIFVNLGDDVNLSDEVKKGLVDVFGQLEQIVIWKLDERIWNLPSNVHVMKTVSQRQVLSHPNTVIFISSGDLLSLFDTAFYGVPVVGIPVFIDQHSHINALLSHGAALKTELTDNLAWNIKENINEFFKEPRYTINAKAVSSLIRNYLVPPKQELLYWIDLVRNGGAEHLRSPALRVTSVERYYVDIIILVLMCGWFLSKVAKVVQVHRSNDTKKEV